MADVEEYGVTRLLEELATDLREGRWRPMPARRVFIPKPGTGELRPLSIPTVADRIVQAAMKIVLEPIFEADFLPCSFGFRPKRSTHDGLQVLIDESWQGQRWVVETDIAQCFEAIPHEKLMNAVEERVSDRAVLKLLRAMLRAGVMQDGSVRRPVSGTLQGGLCSAEHNPPYAQCWVMRSAGWSVLVRAGPGDRALRITRRASWSRVSAGCRPRKVEGHPVMATLAALVPGLDAELRRLGLQGLDIGLASGVPGVAWRGSSQPVGSMSSPWTGPPRPRGAGVRIDVLCAALDPVTPLSPGRTNQRCA